MMGQPFSGVGIDAYDNMTKKYMTAWMDTMGTGIFMMEGTASADGKTITLRGSHPEPGGGKMTHRAVWKIVDNNTQTFDMYGAHHGGKEMKVLEITYTRKPEPSDRNGGAVCRWRPRLVRSPPLRQRKTVFASS